MLSVRHTLSFKEVVSAHAHLLYQGRGRVQNNGTLQPLCLRKIPSNFCLSSRCFKISNSISFTSNPIASQTAVSALIPGTSESMREPLKRSISDPYNPVGPLDVSLIGFQSWKFLRPHLTGAGPKDWGASCRAQTSCSSGRGSRP